MFYDIIDMIESSITKNLVYICPLRKIIAIYIIYRTNAEYHKIPGRRDKCNVFVIFL